MPKGSARTSLGLTMQFAPPPPQKAHPKAMQKNKQWLYQILIRQCLNHGSLCLILLQIDAYLLMVELMLVISV